MAAVLLLVLLGAAAAAAAAAAPARAADTSEASDVECLANQFQLEPAASCRNCTEIGLLFHSYQDWLGAEVVGGSNINNNKAATKRKFGADGEVLSRLIGPLEAAASSDANDDHDHPQQQEHNQSDQAGDDGNRDADRQAQRLVARFLAAPANGRQLLEAVEQCRQRQNQSACQMWSNLCVATMYAYSDSADLALGSLLGPAPSSPSVAARPWQHCHQFNLASVCNSLRDWWRLERKPNSVDILNIYAADEPLGSKAIAGSGLQLRLNQPVQLLAYKYTYQGHFLGVDQFGLHQLERFCLGRSAAAAAAAAAADSSRFAGPAGSREPLRVGRSMELRCAQEPGAPTGAAHLNQTVFTDLYLGYQQNGAFFVKPVPILIKNLLYNGQQVNRRHQRDPSRWKLVQRFLFHAVLELDAQEEALIYAKSVQLDLKFRRQDKGMLLSSILLTLDYDYILGAKNQSHREPSTEVIVSQTLVDMLSYRKDLELVVAILGILSSIWSMLKCYHIQKCHGLVKLDLNSLFRFLLISCDTLANLFALVSLAFVGLLFLAFKFQLAPASLQVLGPNQDLEEAILFNLRLAFVFKLVGLAHTFYNPLRADIFFVDWERPKMLTSHQILQHFSHYNHGGKQQHQTSPNPNHLASISAALQPQQQHQHQQAAASFWRPYTVINKWLQLQTFRRQDTTLQLFLFVWLLHLTQVLQLASLEASDHLHHSASARTKLRAGTSRAFRLLLLSAVYLGLSGAQVLAKKYLLEPGLGHRLHQFVDLCSVANVSLFCMLYPKFGYYLHGRNANGSGECGIAEMNALLEREERDLCSKRGLAPNSGQQAFVLILPRIINDHYRKLRRSPPAAASPSSSQPTSKQSLLRSMLSLSLSASSSSSFSLHRSRMETVADRNRTINQFLINFLEHVYKDIDYSIRERRKFESSFLSGELDYDEELGRSSAAAAAAAAGQQSVGAANSDQAIIKPMPATFFKDPGNSFTSLLWLGHEWHLVLFELLALLVLDSWLVEGEQLASSAPATASLALVWLAEQSMKRLYLVAARRNLVAKAMVDEKFCI